MNGLNQITQCEKCKLYKNRTNIVWGKGNENADIMFIGEGPGADEDKEGIPFVGKAGKLLDMCFQATGINKDDVYIANIVKCRPPANRDPEKDEIEACMEYLRIQVKEVNPKIIVLLGRVALTTILGPQHKITEDRGKWFDKGEILILPTFHPAALLRDETKKVYLYKDLLDVVNKLKGLVTC